MVPSQKCGRGVFCKGLGAFSKIWPDASSCKSGPVYPCKSGRAYPYKIGQTLHFAKVAGHFSKSWVGYSLNTLVGTPLAKSWVEADFLFVHLASSSQHLGKQSWAEGVEVRREVFSLRELKFGRRYVRRVPNVRIFENSKIVQCRAKPNIQIFGVPIPSTLADGQPALEFLILKGHEVPPNVKMKSRRSKSKPRIRAQDFRRLVCT
ncbi:hypothetical protein L3X38_009619 [Prunus dulcis]|uniref:Uncharacterized protein n=1 Tax=Prunus dulcis TaxID=3755 RepID=A0AAD4WE74_PRUDU|nr:hypothetical protein L3X38_009619 [Prunus dulcis]